MEEDELSEDENQEENGRKEIKDESKLDDEATKDVILKAKVEDDEYKTDDGEKNYYSIAHTIHEKITEQPSILVNGNLKGITMYFRCRGVHIVFHIGECRASI